MSDLARHAARFQKTLAAAKARVQPRSFGWFPYDTLAQAGTIENLLREAGASLPGLAGDLPVADIGCGDGDLAFFLESLGLHVHAIDHPGTNFNGMAGVRALRDALGSKVEIHALDLDAPFELPGRYALVLFLNTLYHLKNPYYALEALARAARWAIFSTRIAQFAPDRTSIGHLPVAYLLGEREANDDPTNYWVFSETGLRRLLDRSGWNVRAWTAAGNLTASDPATAAGDQRAFCLLESRLKAGFTEVELLEGWHALEPGGWRWTERRFSALLRARPGAATLRLSVVLPDAVFKRLGPVTLRAALAGQEVPEETFARPGAHTFLRRAPAGRPLRADFQLDKALPPGDLDDRELGLIVSSIGLE